MKVGKFFSVVEREDKGRGREGAALRCLLQAPAKCSGTCFGFHVVRRIWVPDPCQVDPDGRNKMLDGPVVTAAKGRSSMMSSARDRWHGHDPIQCARQDLRPARSSRSCKVFDQPFTHETFYRRMEQTFCAEGYHDSISIPTSEFRQCKIQLRWKKLCLSPNGWRAIISNPTVWPTVPHRGGVAPCALHIIKVLKTYYQSPEKERQCPGLFIW